MGLQKFRAERATEIYCNMSKSVEDQYMINFTDHKFFMNLLHQSQFLTAAVSDSRVEHLKLQPAIPFEALVYLNTMFLVHRSSKKPAVTKARTPKTTNPPLDVVPGHMCGTRLGLVVQAVSVLVLRRGTNVCGNMQGTL